MVGVFDGMSLNLYVNGVLDHFVPEPGPIAEIASGLTIGGSSEVHPIGKAVLAGIVDDVALYGYPLTARQVAAHYRVGMANP